MKTTNYLSLSLVAATLIVGTLFFSSCKKDEVEPVPEIVENPLEKEAHFIIGMITDGVNALADVTVSAGNESATTDAKGVYQIKVAKEGTYELSIVKEGYISIKKDVTISNGANKGTIIFYSQILTKKAASIKVSPEKDVQVTSSEGISVAIPVGAVKTETFVTIASFVPAADKTARDVADKAVSSGSTTPVKASTTMSFASLHCEPDGLIFEKPLEVKVKAEEVAEGVYFTKTKHYINGTEEGDAVLDAASNSYLLALKGFSVHEMEIVTDLSVEASNESVYSEVIDNLGKTASVSKDISLKMNHGWKIISMSSGVTGEIEAKMMTALKNILSSSEGISEIEISKKVAVSGDVKMTILFTQALIKYTFEFETNKGVESIVVEQYATVAQSIEKEQGNMKPGHN